MRVKSLTITNAGRHLKIDFDSNAGVVGILGANGSGKSTILALLKFSLTGDTRDNIDSYVRNYTGNATVTTVFEKNGKEGKIFRQFGSTPKRQLTWDGREIKAAKEIEATLSGLFGADRLAVSNAVFIEQGELESILFTLASDRKKSFIRLVNLSYCEQRAKLVEGKIKTLVSTITDLGPAKDAAAESRRLALAELDAVKLKLETAEDWSEEHAYIQRAEQFRIKADQLRGQATQLDTELIVIRQQLQTQFDQVEIESRELIEVALTETESKEKALETEINKLQSIRGELQHYDRVNGNIQVRLQTIKDLDAEIKTLNPDNKSLTELHTALADVERRLKVIAGHTQVDLGIAEEEGTLASHREREALLIVPTPSSEELAMLGVVIEQDKTSAYWLDRTQQLRKQIAGCVTAEAGRPAECSECGLIIQDGSDLTPGEMQKAEQHLQDIQRRITTNQAVYNVGNKKQLAYTAAMNQIAGAIAASEKRLKDLRGKKAGLEALPEESEAELKIDQVKQQNWLQRLQQIPGERNRATETLRSEMTEKLGYKQAAAYQNRREEVSQDKVMEKAEARKPIQAEIKKLKACLDAIIPMEAKIEEKESRRFRLATDCQLADNEANQPGSDRFQALAESLLGDNFLWDRMKVEVQAKQESRTMLVGQMKSANEGYTTANNRYHEIEERIKQDEVKLNLVADLKRLRDLLQDDGLPMAYIRYQFEYLAQLTQDSLNKLNANFAIQIDRSKDLTFSFTRLDEPGGAEHAMNKLSGGQRVRLCVAFLMAVQQRIVKDVGLLVLDEPSVHLDQAGVEEMVEFLRSMQVTLQNTDHQLWVVDHNPSLENVMEKCLVLK